MEDPSQPYKKREILNQGSTESDYMLLDDISNEASPSSPAVSQSLEDNSYVHQENIPDINTSIPSGSDESTPDISLRMIRINLGGTAPT